MVEEAVQRVLHRMRADLLEVPVINRYRRCVVVLSTTARSGDWAAGGRRQRFFRRGTL